jgi:hypothetical protein
LVVVEGPSAVGKTTLLKFVPADFVVGEEVLRVPAGTGPLESIPYAVESSARRWERLLETEVQHGHAYADSDPLKLYYDFARVAIGELDRAVYEAGWRSMARAMGEGKVGFADSVVYLSASPTTLTERRNTDTRRRRGKFALHVRLVPAMRTYYAALEQIRPRTVRWLEAEGAPQLEGLSAPEGSEGRMLNRYDVAALERLKQDLDAWLAKRP